MKEMRRLLMPLMMALAAVVGVVVGYLSGSIESKVNSEVENSSNGMGISFGGLRRENKLQTILDLINYTYVDSIDTDTLLEGVIPQMLQNLDPHSVYIPAKDLQQVNEELSAGFGGVGIQFSIIEDSVNVISVISGTPSSRLGVMPGDKIIRVEGEDFTGSGITNDKVMKALRGPVGSHVKFVVFRDGEEIEFDVERGEIPIHSVDCAYMLDETIGYVRIDRFAENTYSEMVLAVVKLMHQGMQTVVVDLRGNSGGLLTQVLQMCDEFLSARQLIVYTEGLHQKREDVYASGHGRFTDLGVVVLIDEYSASASEIFAGAMQDNDRGVIIGRRSFGKGLVQSQRELYDGSALRMTVARYHTPSGRCIQKPYEKGVKDYYNDVYERYLSGELHSQDSVKFDENQIFKTVGGRTVYGGGGITPDIFVPEDTTRASSYLISLRRKSILYYFAVDYVNRHRTELSELGVNQLIEKLEQTDVMTPLIAFAQKKGIAAPRWLEDSERSYIEMMARANIARNLKDNDAYFQIVNKTDPVVMKAVEIAQPSAEE